MLPLRPGGVARRTHDYKRNGTTSLFAALEIATGAVTQEARARHTGADFLAFLRRLERVYPDHELHAGQGWWRVAFLASSPRCYYGLGRRPDTSTTLVVVYSRVVRGRSMKLLRACLDRRVLAALAVTAVVIAVVAPQLVIGALPLIVVAACPLSMIVMMATMRHVGRSEALKPEPGAGELRQELADLDGRRRVIEAELSALEPARPLAPQAARR